MDEQVVGCQKWKYHPDPRDQVPCDQRRSEPGWSIHHDRRWLHCEILGRESVSNPLSLWRQPIYHFILFALTAAPPVPCSFGLVKSYNMPCTVESASLEPMFGNKFIAGGEDMWVHVFDFHTGEEISEYPPPPSSRALLLARKRIPSESPVLID